MIFIFTSQVQLLRATVWITCSPLAYICAHTLPGKIGFFFSFFLSFFFFFFFVVVGRSWVTRIDAAVVMEQCPLICQAGAKVKSTDKSHCCALSSAFQSEKKFKLEAVNKKRKKEKRKERKERRETRSSSVGFCGGWTPSLSAGLTRCDTAQTKSISADRCAAPQHSKCQDVFSGEDGDQTFAKLAFISHPQKKDISS